MDKYEYSIKAEKIKKLAERKDYETAAKIADGIDWERIRNVKMLTSVSQVYEKLERYEDAKDILLLAYERAPVGRRFLYKLTELAVRQGEFAEAEEYLKEFAATSPQDPSRLILRYEIAKAKGAGPEQLITILEAYQKREFEEKWSYELASLYYQAGKNEECIKLCDELILWFGVGSYVDKALELKQKIAPLTPEQVEKKENKEKYLRRLESIQKEAEEEAAREEKEKQQAQQQTLRKKEAEQPQETYSSMSVRAEEGRQQVEFERSLAREIEAAIAKREAEEKPEETPKLQPEEAPKVQLKEAPQIQPEEMPEAQLETTPVQEAEEPGPEGPQPEESGPELLERALEKELKEDPEKERESAAVETGPAKTKTFVFEARAISEALEESKGQPIDVRLVEKRAAKLKQEEEEAKAETPQEEMAAQDRLGADYAPEQSQQESAQPLWQPEKEPQDQKPQDQKQRDQEQPDQGQEAADQADQEEQKQKQDEQAAALVNDHYVLIACDDEETGLHECVSYIRRMRELLGHPAIQMAKIRGEKLAAKDLAKTFRKLAGRDLIIIGVASVPDSVLEEVIERAFEDQKESFVALIDSKDEIEKLQERVAWFADCRVLDCAEKVGQTADAAPAAEEPYPTAEAEEAKEEQTAWPVGEAAPEPETTARGTEHRTLAELVEEALRSGGLEGMKTQTAPREEELQPKQEQPLPKREMPRQEAETNEAAKADVKAKAKAAARTEAKAKTEAKAETEARAETEAKAEPKKKDSKEMTPKEFFRFAEDYAQMLDAMIDDLGGLAVFAVAEQYQQERVPLTEELAQELVEKAILRAERRSLKSLFSNRYNKEGYLILKEEHFKE